MSVAGRVAGRQVVLVSGAGFRQGCALGELIVVETTAPVDVTRSPREVRARLAARLTGS